MLGKGDGSFQSAQSYAVGSNPSYVTAADFNNDGFLDLAIGNDSSTVNIVLGQGDGTFQTPQSYFVGGGPVSVAVGDVNGDFKVDILDVALVAYSFGTKKNQARWNAAADINSDGVIDIFDVALSAYYFGTSDW